VSEPLVEIHTTVASQEDAVDLARRLIASGLVACVNLFPVRSIYPWKGELCDESEVQLVCKTLETRAAETEARLRELHPYETPAVLRMPVLRANEDYAAWVAECVRNPGR